MGRRRKDPVPFWWSARQCYYLQVGKKQIRLDADFDTAKRMAHKILSEPQEEPKKVLVEGTSPTVISVLEGFLDWTEAHREKPTYDAYKTRLQHFIDSLKAHDELSLTVEKLRPLHVNRVTTAKGKAWSENYQHDFIQSCERAMNWGKEQGLFDRHSLERMKKPGRQARELVVSPEEYETILSHVKSSSLRMLLEVTWETGLRVQEVRKIEAKFVDLKAQTIVFPPSKSKGKKRSRIVYIGTEKAVTLITDACKKHPSGPIFRNARGNPWTKDAINNAFCRLQEKVGVKYHLGALRKSFATEAIKNGVDTVSLAHLMGHTDTTMVSKVYARVAQDTAHMKAMAKKARGKKDA